MGNASALADALVEGGLRVVAGGTDNHLMLIDLRSKSATLTGKLAEETLGKCHITINKNTVPFEERSPFVTSGIRLGTPALTTRGFNENDMVQIADFMDTALMNHSDESQLKKIADQINDWAGNFPLFA